MNEYQNIFGIPEGLSNGMMQQGMLGWDNPTGFNTGTNTNFGNMPSWTDGGLYNAAPQTLGARAFGGVKDFGNWAADPSNQALLGAGVGLLQGVGNFANGFTQNKAYKKQMNNQNAQWDKMYQRQTSMINEQMHDRQRKRQEANPNQMSPDDYVKKFGV